MLKIADVLVTKVDARRRRIAVVIAIVVILGVQDADAFRDFVNILPSVILTTR